MLLGEEAGWSLAVPDVDSRSSSTSGSALNSPLLNGKGPHSPSPAKPSKGGRRTQMAPQHTQWEQCTAKGFHTRTLEATTAAFLALPVGMVLGAAMTVLLRGTGTSGQEPAAEATTPTPYALAMPPSEVPPAYVVSPGLNNSCLIPSLAIPDGPRSFDACGFVVRSTDEVWNLRGDVDAAIDKYFHEDYVDAGSWGRRLIGKKALRDAVLSEMRAFPDIQIHITDCSCQGNDIDGYKCAMPDTLTGTNMGPSSYGPATGKAARWTGMVQSLVKRNPKTGQWQYYAEWGVHDEWALLGQLGLDVARVPRPAVNSEPLHDCSPLLRFRPEPEMDANDAEMQQAHVRAKALRGARP